MCGRENINLNAQNINGNTPLHSAFVANKVEVVDFLVDQPNVDVNVHGHLGVTPLQLHYISRPREAGWKL
jgi:ankyrin repeat protein